MLTINITINLFCQNLYWFEMPNLIHRHTLSPRCTMFDLFIIHGVFKVVFVFFGQEKKKSFVERNFHYETCVFHLLFFIILFYFLEGVMFNTISAVFSSFHTDRKLEQQLNCVSDEIKLVNVYFFLCPSHFYTRFHIPLSTFPIKLLLFIWVWESWL